MRIADVRALAQEARGLAFGIRDEASVALAGPVVVSGVLAEQLAKELGAGATPGAVLVATKPLPHASVHVHVIAGDPTEADESLVESAARQHVDVVLVELWPQADWTKPFVLSPFVVECRAGEGFPVEEIAERIVDATEDAPELASRVPALAAAARRGMTKQAVVRSALVGLLGARLGPSRPLLVREQARLAARLRTVSAGTAVSDDMRVLAGSTVAALASGLALREAARTARVVLPKPLVHAGIAAAGTWVFAKAFETLESRLPSA